MVNDLATLFGLVMQAHTIKNLRDSSRRFDNQTPFFIHPLGMACIILNDATLPFATRIVAAIAAAIHDVFEDTSMTETDLLEPFQQESQLVVREAIGLVRDRLTFQTSSESQAVFEADPNQATLPECLVRGADIVDNLITFTPNKREKKLGYMKLLVQQLCLLGAADCEVNRRLVEMIGRIEK